MTKAQTHTDENTPPPSSHHRLFTKSTPRALQLFTRTKTEFSNTSFGSLISRLQTVHQTCASATGSCVVVAFTWQGQDWPNFFAGVGGVSKILWEQRGQAKLFTYWSNFFCGSGWDLNNFFWTLDWSTFCGSGCEQWGKKSRADRIGYTLCRRGWDWPNFVKQMGLDSLLCEQVGLDNRFVVAEGTGQTFYWAWTGLDTFFVVAKLFARVDGIGQTFCENRWDWLKFFPMHKYC